MVIVKCPNCGICVEIIPESLGRQVGCVCCSHIYILSEQYHDTRYRQFIILIVVSLSLVVVGLFVKIEHNYRFGSKYVKIAYKALQKKHEELFVEKDSSGGLLFFDFDSAYGTKEDKLKRTKPIVLPEHKGRIAEWQGEISEIGAVKDHPYGSFYVKFRHSQVATSNVTVYFRDDQYQSLEGLEIGNYKSYQGVIVSAGYGNTDHILKRGKILD